MTGTRGVDSIDALIEALATVGYQAERRLATAVFLSLRLQRPLLLEGEPGVGKTELAKALSKVLGRPLIRLQCYDGMEQREACQMQRLSEPGEGDIVDGSAQQ